MDILNEGLPRDHIDQNDFTSFVLSNNPFSMRGVFDKLLKDPSSVSLLLSSERSKALFLSDLSDRIPRLLLLISYISTEVDNGSSLPNEGYKTLVEYMINGLALPLVVMQEIHETRGLIELLINLTSLAYSTRGRTRRGAIHNTILREMSNSIALMAQLLSHRDGAKLMQKMVSEERDGMDGTVLGSKRALALWTQAAADLCRTCRVGHCVSQEVEFWDRLIKLRENLVSQVREAIDLKAKQPGTGLPSLSNMRALSKDDKKSGKSLTTSSSVIKTLPPEELSTLRAFTSRELTSISAAEIILEDIESKQFSHIFLQLVKTFPCAVCLGGKEYKTAPQANDRKHGLNRKTFPDNFSRTLFGENLGHWRVCLSDMAFDDLVSTNKKEDLVAIANKLKQIASGQWDRALMKPLSERMKNEAGCTVLKIPLWRAAYGSRGRILWQINVAYEEECDADTQIVTVWRIGNKQEISAAVKAVHLLQKTYSRSDIDQRKVWVGSSDMIFPQTFQSAEDGSDTALEEEDKVPNSRPQVKLSDSDIAAQHALINNKFYSMTERILDCLFSEQDSSSIAVPFILSRKETEIIKHANTAAFILGRSGTGKTTCLLYKLLSRYMASREEHGSIRQIFLTRSSYLADRLNDYLKKLVDTQVGQLDRTYRKSSNGESYSLQEDEDPLYGMSLYNIDDEQFPMVCTFDQFLMFIEKCIKTYDRQNHSGFENGKEPETPSSRKGRLIDYNVFREQYWPAMSHLAKQFEVDQIFAEILGVIKGSTSAKRDLRPLSREEYLTMSTRVAPVFTEVEDREIVFTVYESYERKKARFGDQDDIDRVVHILRALEKQEDLKVEVQSLFDEVYVDELQDQRLLEIDLLLTVVRNPHGIHFAGDTAQCISRDSTFRFQDVKARFFQHFEEVAIASSQPSVSRPELFRLLKNYRSHQGILSLAADIVDMLCNGFPGQIDKLPREIGSDGGGLPVVFTGFNSTQLAQGGAGLTGSPTGLSCFGAEQVILVRDDITKKHLQEILPSTLILTILQSKGLEFEDVVLFNFFTDSNLNWTAVNMKTLKQLSGSGNAFGQFDSSRYAGLCSELKHLYVAVTRARENLWIIEDHPKAIQNILAIWTGSKQGVGPLVKQLDGSEADALSTALSIIKPGKSTKPEAWIKQGEILLQRQLFTDALRCFKRAGHKQGENLANAHILYDKATAVTANGILDESLYSEAGGLFEQAGFYRMASVCWSAVGEFSKAADILETYSEFGRAAPLYEKAQQYAKAAWCYDQSKQYDNAIHAYRKGELFSQLIPYLQQHKNDISKGVRARYSALSNILLQRKDPKISSNLLPAAKEVLGNDKEQEQFYENFGYNEDLSQLHISRKDYKAAFQLALKQGKHEEALKLCQTPEAASMVPEEQLLALYNCLEAQRLWSHPRGNPLETKLTNSFRETPTSALRAATLGWDFILSVITESGKKLILERPPYDTSPAGDFLKTWGSEIFDLYELLNLTDTEKIKLIKHESEFPVESVARFAHMAGDILIGKALYTATLPLFGVLEVSSKPVEANQTISTNEDDSVAHVFKWSPLYVHPKAGMDNNEPSYSTMNLSQVRKRFGDWVTRLVAGIGTVSLERFYNLERDRHRQVCANQLFKGHCARGGCNYLHKIPSLQDIKLQIDSLYRLAGLFCSFTRIYYHRKFDGIASRAFQTQKRMILETLLAQLTFASPILHDRRIQDDTWSLITTQSSETLSCQGGIADLFFYRLGEEWNQRGYLSALLEERDLASRLGVLEPFTRRVHKWNRWHWQCLKDYSVILDFDSALSHKDFIETCERIIGHHVILVTSAEHIWELTVFHATLSMFEVIALGLLTRITMQDILVPSSLKKLLNTKVHIATTSQVKDKLTEYLVWTLTTLCGILKNIGSYAANHEIEFTVCGRKLGGSRELLINRGLNFLAICMANIGVGRTIPTNFYSVLWAQVVGVYIHWRGLKRKLKRESAYTNGTVSFLRAPPSSIDWERIPRNVDELPLRLFRTYKPYDKDTLIIIAGFRPHSQQSRFHSLLEAGIKLHPRKADLEIATPIAIGEPAPTQTDQTEPSSAEQAEVEAAGRIWAFWKKYQPQLQQKRSDAKIRAKRLLTYEGTARVIIEDILPFAYRGHRDALVNIGIPLLTEILTTQGQIESLNTKAKAQLANQALKLTVDNVERLQEIVSLFVPKAHREIQDTIAGFKIGKGAKLRKIPIEKLKRRLCHTASKHVQRLQKTVEVYEKDLGDMGGKTEAVSNGDDRP